MELKYKLKVEARQFFDEKDSKVVEKLEYWKDNLIPIQLLEEVDLVYIEYGQEDDSGEIKTRTLQGWNQDPLRAHFDFTLKFRDLEYDDYKKINIPELMDKIQVVVNIFFNKINAEDDEKIN